MVRKIVLLVSFLAATTGAVGFYFTPHLALDRMKRAAERGDAAALSAHIDYPVFRANLKRELSQRMATPAPNVGPLGALAASFGQALVEPMVDALVQPENLALLLSGSVPQRAKVIIDLQGDAANTPEQSYDGLNRFVVHFGGHGSNNRGFSLIMLRSGLTTWKLSDIQLP